MTLHCHYYVLSLGINTSVLFEAFRDQLVEIRNQGFPVPGPPDPQEPASIAEFVSRIDRCLAHYHEPDPLGIVLVGEQALLSAFTATTSHGPSIVGRLAGDHSGTSLRDLGRIVWPMVKSVMSRETPRALRRLTHAAQAGRATCGLEAVAESVRDGVRGLLLVEEDLHVRGGLERPGRSPAVTAHVDVRDALDDVVDAVIEKALGPGGRVVFVPAGALRAWDRIALVPEEEETA